MGTGLVVLTVGSERMSREFRAAAARLGYELDCAHVREDVRDWVSREVDDIVRDLAAALSRWSRPPDAVINFGRAGVLDGIERIAEAIAQVADRGLVGAGTKLVGPSPHAARVWGDKALIARSLRRLGLPIPHTVEVDPDQVPRGEPRLPAVVKVVNLTGGVGMRYAADAGRLDAAVKELSRLGRPMVVSEFTHGDEVSVDLLRLGTDVLVYPPGFKRATDTDLTHADHKIKVNGVVRSVAAFERDVVRIAGAFDLQGFLSIEAVVTGVAPMAWHILEGATRVTNNIQMQDASLGFDSFAAVARYLAGEPWLPGDEKLGLALSVPVYTHRGQESVDAIGRFDWVRQVKLEDLARMPDSRDDRVRLTVKLAVVDLDAQLAQLADATGDRDLPSRVAAEVARIGVAYGH